MACDLPTGERCECAMAGVAVAGYAVAGWDDCASISEPPYFECQPDDPAIWECQ